MASVKEGPSYWMAGDGDYGGSGHGGGMSARGVGGGSGGGSTGASSKRKVREETATSAAEEVLEVLERVGLKPVSAKPAEKKPAEQKPLAAEPVLLKQALTDPLMLMQQEDFEEAELPPPVISEKRLFSGERLELDMMYQLEGAYTLEAFHDLQERLEALEGVISRVELMDGDVFVSTSGREPHAVAISNLMISLSLWVRKQKLGTVYTVFGLLLDQRTEVIPDLFYVTEEELKRCEEKGVRGGASLVVEVLSPSTAHVDRNRKKKKYEEAGVGEYWLVDVKRQQVEVWREAVVGQGWKRRLLSGEELLATESLPGWSLPLEAVFDRMWVHEDPEALVIAATLNAEIEEQKGRLAALESERTRAEAERTRAEAAAQALSEKLNAEQSERTRAEAERTRAEAERTRAEAAAQALSDKLNTEQAVRARAEAERACAEAERTRAEAAAQALSEKLNAEQSERTRAEAERTRAEAAAQALSDKLNAEQSERTRAEAERTRAEAAAQALSDKLNAEQTERARAEAERTRAEAAAQALSEKLKAEQSERTRAEAAAKALSDKLSAEQAERARMADELALLKAQLAQRLG